MKEWLDCCMDVGSSYNGSDSGLQRLPYQSKVTSVNIRENVKHARFRRNNSLSKFIGSF